MSATGTALASLVGRGRASLHGAVVDDRAARAGAVGGRGANGAALLSGWTGARALVTRATAQVEAGAALGAGGIRRGGALLSGAVVDRRAGRTGDVGGRCAGAGLILPRATGGRARVASAAAREIVRAAGRAGLIRRGRAGLGHAVRDGCTVGAGEVSGRGAGRGLIPSRAAAARAGNASAILRIKSSRARLAGLIGSGRARLGGAALDGGAARADPVGRIGARRDLISAGRTRAGTGDVPHVGGVPAIAGSVGASVDGRRARGRCTRRQRREGQATDQRL